MQKEAATIYNRQSTEFPLSTRKATLPKEGRDWCLRQAYKCTFGLLRPTLSLTCTMVVVSCDRPYLWPARRSLSPATLSLTCTMVVVTQRAFTGCLPGLVKICHIVLEISWDFCDLFWPHMTLTFDLLALTLDNFRPLPRGPLVPICIKTDSFVFNISCSTVL